MLAMDPSWLYLDLRLRIDIERGWQHQPLFRMPDVRATVGTPVRELNDTVRRVVARVALMNLGYFGIEFGVALAIGSVSLFADGVDFLEDAQLIS
jgi:Co/Zn/Cd efflux system component